MCRAGHSRYWLRTESALHELGDVLGEDVGFEIDPLTCGAGGKVGLLHGVGDDPEAREGSFHFRDGERNAVDREGTFVDAEFSDGFGKSDL